MGWGEGLANTVNHPLFLYASRPHPGPLPEGDGIRKALTGNPWRRILAKDISPGKAVR